MNEPRFQYSVFPDGNKGEQYVVRADTIDELAKQKTELKNFLERTATLPAKVVPPTPQPEDDLIVTCKDCGGSTTYREGVSKTTGKPWRAHFCNKPNSTCKPYFVR